MNKKKETIERWYKEIKKTMSDVKCQPIFKELLNFCQLMSHEHCKFSSVRKAYFSFNFVTNNCNNFKLNSNTLFLMLKDCEFSRRIVTMWSHHNYIYLFLLYLMSVWQCGYIVCWVQTHCLQVTKIISF